MLRIMVVDDEPLLRMATGAFVGICVQDLYRRQKHDDFDYFEYVEI